VGYAINNVDKYPAEIRALWGTGLKGKFCSADCKDINLSLGR
jgi:hypothetical protein